MPTFMGGKPAYRKSPNRTPGALFKPSTKKWGSIRAWGTIQAWGFNQTQLSKIITKITAMYYEGEFPKF